MKTKLLATILSVLMIISTLPALYIHADEVDSASAETVRIHDGPAVITEEPALSDVHAVSEDPVISAPESEACLPDEAEEPVREIVEKIDFPEIRDAVTDDELSPPATGPVAEINAYYSGSCGDNANWSLDTDSGLLSITGTGAMTNYSSYSSVPWYSYRSYVNTISIGSGVTNIGYYAFYGCTGLTSVTIPDNVITIERYAFSKCTELSNVILSNNLDFLGNQAFEDTAIREITIPKSLSSCGASSNLANTIYYGPFSNCVNLKTVTFEEGHTCVPTYLLANCPGIEEIELPDTITTIHWYSFHRCTNLRKVVLGGSETTIRQNAFQGCISLQSIVIPDSVTTIEKFAFSKCTELSNVILSNNLDFLGNQAFEDTAIREITIPKSLSSCGASSNLANTIYYGPFSNCVNLKTVTFEEGHTCVPTYLLANCPGIEEIELPDTITTIHWYSFHRCTNLREVVLGGSETTIRQNAFQGCISLQSIDIPDSVTTIEKFAFENCTSLESIVIPDSVTSIGINVFADCSSLISAKLPNKRKIIMQYMFQNCISLKTIEIPSTVTTIQSSAFSGCASLESFSFKNGKSNLQEIQNNAFYGCSSIIEAILPETVKTIGDNAFQNCAALEKLYIPESTKTLGSYAFQGDESLTDVTISDYSITKLKDYTFKDCTALASIVLPKGLTTVGSQVFKNDTSLFDVTIPESVTSINSNAFSYPAKTTIHGKAGSYAETFAVNGGFKFNDIGVAAEGISLVDGVENITLEVGETYRAVFEVFPKNANDVIAITSDNSNVTINGHDIYAKKAGNTVLTAIASSGVAYEFNVYIRSVSKIAVKTPADKLTYYIGELFDSTGLVVEVIYNDKSTKEVTDFVISGFDSSVEGTCTVTLSWVAANGSTYTTTFNVEIVDPAPKLTGIVIQSLPTKIEYERGEPLDLTGMVVIGIYTDESSREVTDYTVSGYNALKYGTQTITVTYQDKTATFIVTVKCASHSFGEWTVTVEPACTETGEKSHTCIICGMVETEVIPALGHDYNSVATEPTCTEQGYTTYTCTRCGDSYVDDYVDAKGHTWSDWTETKTPTCTEKGEEERVCSVCKEKETHEVEALGHDYIAVVTEPTCTEKGYTTHTCSRCGDSYVDTYVDAHGHNFGEWIVIASPTCTENGVEERVCSACGEKETREIEVLGHDYVAAVTEPTCTEQGYTTHTCSRCSDSYVDTYIDALGHTWGEWETEKKPSYDEEGLKSHVCSVCGAREEEAIDKLVLPANTYTDVKDGKWYTKGVLYCVQMGFMSGTGTDTFDPNSTLTRAMFVTILAKIDGADLSAYAKDTNGLPFTDVKASWYIKALKWAYEYKYTSGTSDTTFGPNDPVTREQLAVFLYSYSQKKGYDVSELADISGYTDAGKISKWARTGVQWAIAAGMISGTSETTLSPKDTATRAQVAVIIMNYDLKVKVD